MTYRVVLARSASKELDRLPARIHARVIDRLRGLENDPRPFGSEKLTGILAYKLRVGNYRIIYQINDKNHEVKIAMIDDRKQVYKRLKQ